MPLRCFRQPVKALIRTPSRAFGTVYQNTTGRPMLVIVEGDCFMIAADEQAYMTAQVMVSSPPTTYQAQAGLISGGIRRNKTIIVIAVPNQYYYRVNAVTTGSAGIVLNFWTEVEL